MMLLTTLALMLAAAPAAAPEVKVSISSLKYKPAVVQVNVGDTVVWTNDDDADHTVTAETFKSGNISSGKSFSQKFEKAGEYPYHCDYHPRMKGKVVVVAGGKKK